MIADIYKGGPVGVETLAAGLSEPRDTIEEVIEPFLIQLGLVARTARGRCLNGRGLDPSRPAPAQDGAGRACSTEMKGKGMKMKIAASLHCCRRCCRRPRAAQAPASAAARRPVDYASRCAPGSACPAAPTPAAGRCRPTALNPNGYGSTGAGAPGQGRAEVDCFYVYPTVSRDPGPQQRPRRPAWRSRRRRRSSSPASAASAGPSRRSTAR